MAKVREVVRFLDEKAPFSYQMDYDNAGFLLGKENSEVSCVLVALDLTQEVLEEAIEKQVDLIVTHHPLIWNKLSALTDQDIVGRKILTLLEHGIAVISAHTNLDAVEGGVNSELARLLKLKDPLPLHEDGVDLLGRSYGIGRVGERGEGVTTLDAFAAEVKVALCLEGLRLLDAGRPVLRVAVGGGACGGMLADVLRHNCDTFVSSEFKHDAYLEARALGINLIDAGHYGTEAIVCPVLADWLHTAFPDLLIKISSCQREVFSYR